MRCGWLAKEKKRKKKEVKEVSAQYFWCAKPVKPVQQDLHAHSLVCHEVLNVTQRNGDENTWTSSHSPESLQAWPKHLQVHYYGRVLLRKGQTVVTVTVKLEVQFLREGIASQLPHHGNQRWWCEGSEVFPFNEHGICVVFRLFKQKTKNKKQTNNKQTNKQNKAGVGWYLARAHMWTLWGRMWKILGPGAFSREVWLETKNNNQITIK